MRILFSVHGYKPAWRIGGPIESVSSLAEHLVQMGHQVDVFTTNSNLDERLDVPLGVKTLIEGVWVTYFEIEEIIPRFLRSVSYMTKSIGYLYTPKMKKALNECIPRMNLVHTHMPFIYPTLVASGVARKHSIPLFYHQRGVFDPARMKFRSLKKTIYIQLIEKRIMQHAEMLFALTRHEEDSYRNIVKNVPIKIIPNGIDTTKYYQSVSKDALHEYGIEEEDTVILFMGRLHPTKGADKLLKAFLRITAERRKVKLILAGPDEFEIETMYREMVAETGRSKRVIFPGMVTGEIKKILLSRSDLFCLPSEAEGFSMAILEALASKTAVLISDGCHFTEVEKSNAGIIVKNDIGSIESGIRRLLNNKTELSKMGENGYELVKSRYSWKQIAEETYAAYQEGIRSCERKKCKKK